MRHSLLFIGLLFSLLTLTGCPLPADLQPEVDTNSGASKAVAQSTSPQYGSNDNDQSEASVVSTNAISYLTHSYQFNSLIGNYDASLSWYTSTESYSQIQISQGTTSVDSMIVDDYVTGNSYTINLPAGVYYWRVRAVDGNRQPLSGWVLSSAFVIAPDTGEDSSEKSDHESSDN